MPAKAIISLLVLLFQYSICNTYPYVTQQFTYGIVEHQSDYQISFLKPNYDIQILTTNTKFKGFPISDPSTPLTQAFYSRVSTIETFNPHTRTIFQVLVQRGYPSLVESDINGNVIDTRRFDSAIFFNLDYDMDQKRLLTLYYDALANDLVFSSFPTNSTGFAIEEKLFSLNSSFAQINVGSSSFDQANSLFYYTSTQVSGTELNVSTTYLVTIDVKSKSVKSNVTLPPSIVDITAIVHSQDSQILAVISQLNVDHYEYYLVTINTLTGLFNYTYDFQLESNEFQLEFPGRASVNYYQPEIINFILRSSIGPLFLEFNLTSQTSRSFVYPKDAYLTEFISVSNCTLGQAEVNGQCVDCEVGHFAGNYLLDSCDSCESGTFANETQMSACVPCALGYYAGQPAATVCQPCASGKYSDVLGASICEDCGVGYVSEPGSVYCTPCSSGNIFTSDSCESCALGQFNPVFASTTCFDCEPGLFAGDAQGSTLCTPCDYGYYNPKYGQEKCLECPVGGVCNGTGLKSPTSDFGYYSSISEAFSFVQCIPRESCLGNDTCASSYFGTYCSYCSPGFYRLDSVCKECPQNAEFRMVLFVLLALFLVIGFTFLAIRYKKRLSQIKKTGFYSSIVIGYSFFQVIAIMSSYNLGWPDLSRSAMSWAWFANFNADNLASDCTQFKLNFFEKYLFFVSLPLMIIVFILLRYLSFLIVQFFADRYESWWRNKFPSLFDISVNDKPMIILKRIITWFLTKKDASILYEVFCETINASCGFMSSIYIFIASFTLSYIDCVVQPDGTYLLESNSSIQCFHGDWLSWFPVFFFSILIYVIGIPATMFFVLWKNRNHLDSDRIYSQFGLLYIRYKHPSFYWELVVLSRKFIVSIIRIFGNSNPAAQASISIVFLVGFSGLTFWRRPFLVLRHNLMEVILVALNALFLIIGVSFYASPFSETAMNALVILLLVVAFIYALLVFLQDLRIHLRISKISKEIELDDQ